MGEVKMQVKLLAHTQLSKKFSIDNEISNRRYNLSPSLEATDGQIVALSAVRTCYSPNKPSEIFELEGDKYFENKATDGEGGSEADRLFRMIFRSKHVSTVEHLTFTFAVEGISRALLAQLTRHRVGFSFSVQSQRYVKFGSDDRSGGFDYVKPSSITSPSYAEDIFEDIMAHAQQYYDKLRKAGVPAEDARAVLPNAAATNLVMTVNLRSLLDFYGKRRKGRGAQAEITELAEALRKEVVEVEPWTEQFFEAV